MLAPAPLVLASRPSAAVARAAQAAASSPHGLVNLGRVVRALGRDESADWLDVTKAWETVLYARALLGALSERADGTSASAAQLDGMRQTLGEAEERLLLAAKSTGVPRVPTPHIALTAQPEDPSAAEAPSSPSTASASIAAPAPAAPALPPRPAPKSQSTDPATTRTLGRRAAPSTRAADYLAGLARENAQGAEVGLLPLRVRQAPKPVEDGRDELLGGASGGGLGAAQLHEELGGQLVGMSQRLRLNAIHFANSLEEEKSLLDASSDVLEKNLADTQSSKAQLSTVRKKGRGTTCLTIGVVLLVMILFIWTYLLIKFT